MQRSKEQGWQIRSLPRPVHASHTRTHTYARSIANYFLLDRVVSIAERNEEKSEISRSKMEEFCDATQLILESESPWRDRAIDTELDRVNGDRGKKRRRRRRRGRRKKFAQKWNERSVTASDNRWPVSGFAANPRIGARFIAGPAVLSNNTNYSYVNNEPGIISIPSPPTRPIQFAVTIP